MDKKEQKDQTAAFASWVDCQLLRQQSQWLQTILSDLDTKINAILSIIVQDDGDSFAKRAEMYYQKRPQLIQMVEELHKSYRSLAENYDQLRSEVKNHGSHPKFLLSLSTSVNQVQGQQHVVEGKELSGVESNFQSKSSNAEDPDHDDEFSKGQATDHEFTPVESSKSSKMKPNEKCQEKKNINSNGNIVFQRNTSEGYQAAMLENEKIWNELRSKVSELVEDNLSHQAELIRRNDEKRETIRDLCCKMNMMDEDRADMKNKTSLISNKFLKKGQSQLSRLKRLFLGRFMK